MADFTDTVFFLQDLSLSMPDDVTALLDLVPPTATLLSPSQSAPLQVDTSVSVRVTDDRSIARIFLWAEYANTSSEVIYRDGAFLPAFSVLSTANLLDTRTMQFVIARGIDVNGNRVGGWPSSPKIYVGGIDGGGNVS